ncbi:hypothetical protein GE061_009472, partial [Apolygus lucorum]
SLLNPSLLKKRKRLAQPNPISWAFVDCEVLFSSLHAGDSSVFGIKSEEYSALCRRFPDSNKQVINGVLIKGSPLEVINSLAELGYRVTCSSGETEIVWTLRREALIE